MRASCWSRAAAICGALALACSVETEGAPCGTPGDTAQCPSGQACGNDKLCSARALECTDTRCVVETVACRDGDGWRCTDADPVCGAWALLQTVHCTEIGLECKGAAERCDCPAAGPEFEVDATNVNPTDPTFGPLTPTGARSNDACRLATLGAALTAAGTYAAEHPGVATTVRAVVAPEGGFGPAAGDALPIVVPAGVSLESGSPASPDGSLIVSNATVTTMVRLDAGAAMAGFTIRNQLATPDVAPSGSAVACDAGATVSNVAIETNNLAFGVRVTGACNATLRGVNVYGPRKAGVYVETPGVTSEIEGGSFTARGAGVEQAHGIWVKAGSLSIHAAGPVSFSPLAGTFTGGAPVDISGSTGSGIYTERDTAVSPISLSIDRARITGNGAPGIHLFNLAPASAVALTGTAVEANGAVQYGTRSGGGVVVPSPAASGLTLTLRSSRIWRNAGDQVGLDVPDVSGAYDLSGGGSCEAASNVLGSCGPTTLDIFSTTANNRVAAQQNYWQSDTPRVTGTNFDPRCTWPAPAPTCP